MIIFDLCSIKVNGQSIIVRVHRLCLVLCVNIDKISIIATTNVRKSNVLWVVFKIACLL